MRRLRCVKHPRYQVKRFPFSCCSTCMYLWAHRGNGGHPEAEEEMVKKGELKR